MMEQKEVEDIYPMSDIQKGMIFHSLLEKNAYCNQRLFQLKIKDFEPHILDRSFLLLVKKHSILRTGFNMFDYEEPVQIVFESVPLNVEHYDLSSKNKSEQEEFIKNILHEDRNRYFNFDSPVPLWRSSTFKLGDQYLLFLWVAHHAIIDGWSFAALMTELYNTYQALKLKPDFVPNKLRSSYKMFVVEQIIEKSKKENIEFWEKELTDYKRLKFPGCSGKPERIRETRNIERDLSFLRGGLLEAAHKYDVSARHLCFGAYVFMLNLLTFDCDILVGSVTHNRPLSPDGDKIIGCFLNTVPVRIKIPDCINWSEYVRIVKSKLLELMTYDRISLFEIIRLVGETRQNENPLFDTIFNFVDFHIYRQLNPDHFMDRNRSVNERVLSVAESGDTNTLFDFSISFGGEELVVLVAYDDSILDDIWVNRLCGYFERILEKIIFEPQSRATKYALLTPEERERLSIRFNDTLKDYPEEKPVQQLFSEQVAVTPDYTALIFEDKQLSYGGLERRALRVARKLREWGIGSHSIVGIMSDRSLELIAGILGILKTGGAYLPIESSFPAGRVHYIVQDSGLKVLLSGEEPVDSIGSLFRWLDLEESGLDTGTGDDFPIPSASQNPAYVLYTSGSTGQPKGVLVEQRSVVNIITYLNRRYPLGREDRYLFKTSYIFDVSVSEIFGFFSGGGCLAILGNRMEREPEEIVEEIWRQGVTHINFVPSMFAVFLETLTGELLYKISSLRYIFLAGEALLPELVRRYADTGATAELENLYGPTEGTVYVSGYSLAEWVFEGGVPIGRPLSNIRFYVLDRYNQCQVPGAPGELCVGGDCLARGYLNRPELTAERFMKHPLARNGRLYLTGDLACWQEDGNLAYLGRLDEQVKIRGFRVELGEIENQLLALQWVNEAVVVARDDSTGDRYLCAYLVQQANIPAARSNFDNPEVLRNYLKQKLPDYMIPSYFVFLEQMPLNQAGKIDRKMLPEPDNWAVKRYIAPRSELERKLAAIWSQVLDLKVDRVSVEANFFDLGGHSLKAATLRAKIYKELKVQIPITQIFKQLSIAALASYIIKQNGFDSYTSIKPVENLEYYPLSSAQKRLYVLQQMAPEGTFYNLPQAVRLYGELEKERFRQVFNQLIDRHESFRTSFITVNEMPVQRISVGVDMELELFDSALAGSVDAILENFVRPFDLSSTPLMRAGLIQLKKREYILIVDMHHIVSDGLSMDIVIKDFILLLKGEKLARLRLQYKDYTGWLKTEEVNRKIKKQKEFWRTSFSGDIPILNLPYDFSPPPVHSFRGSTIVFDIGEREISNLNHLKKQQGTTLYMAFLAILYILLSKLANQEDIVIGTVSAGRQHSDLEYIIGMFVNTLPLRSYPIGGKTFSQFLAEVKMMTLQSLENQDYPFEDLVASLAVKRETNRNPLFNVGFSLSEGGNKAERILKIDTNGLRLESYPMKSHISKVDLTINGSVEGKKISFIFEYSTDLFKEETVRRIANYYKILISNSIIDVDLPLAEIDMLPEAERQRLLEIINGTAMENPPGKTIHALFEEQANRTPDQKALRFTVDFGDLLDAEHEYSIDKYEKLCFKKNRYLFRYKGTGFLNYGRIRGIDRAIIHELILLRTHRENYVAVNSPLFAFLNYLDGKTNLGSIMAGLENRRVRFVIFDSTGSREGEALSFKQQVFDINDSFKDVLPLMRILCRVHLVIPVGINAQPILLNILLDNRTLKRKNYPLHVRSNSERKDAAAVLLIGDTPGTASVGLIYLAAYLRRNGIEAYCQLIDTLQTMEGLREHIETLISEIKPSVVGVSMKWFPHISRVFEICRIVKTLDNSIRVVVGGNTASYFCEEVIQSEWIDCVIRGDGEIPLLNYCRGETRIPNSLNKIEGKIIRTPIEYVQDGDNNRDVFLSHLDEIFVSPADPYLVQFFYIPTGKGCSQSCLYCAGCLETQKQIFNRPKPFLRGVGETRRDLKAVMNYTSTLMFDFDLPLYDSNDYYRQIWEDLDLSRHFCRFYFWKLPSVEFIELVTATFNYVYIEIDLCSLSENHRLKLASMGLVKPQPSDRELYDFFDLCENYDNVEVYINQILGLPYFTEIDIKKSYESLYRITERSSKFRGINWGRLHAQPGAPITNNCERFSMHSHATSFKDFFQYSHHNLVENIYPSWENLFYPFIYFNNDDLNSRISGFYSETEKYLAQMTEGRRKRLAFTEDMNYGELEKRANLLARALVRKGVGPDTIVALAAMPTFDAAAAILGILKAGGAFLPVDLNYPPTRIDYMLQDSGVALLLTDNSVTGEMNGVEVIETNRLINESASLALNSNQLIRNNSKDLAYCIYTSGTTGWPKGVAIQHGGAVNTLLFRKGEYKMTPGDVSLQLFPCVFDGFITSFFTPLISGSLVVLLSEPQIKDVSFIIEAVEKNRVSHFICVPPLYRLIIENLSPLRAATLKSITLAGDKVTMEMLEITNRKEMDFEIVNEYGLTETSVMSTIFRHQERDPQIKIGKPISNAAVYILNRHNRLQPVGIPGELGISGTGLARGYLNQPELTAERFISISPFPGSAEATESSVFSGYIYRTGDLARWLPDGNIEFLGRIDDQVKIRGFRIELPEIESVLLKQPNIKNAVVISRRDRNSDVYLCAYIVEEKTLGQSLDIDALKENLLKIVPSYMIPADFVSLDRIPLNPTGKVDRNALPEPELYRKCVFVPPADEIEMRLSGIWAQVLGIDKRMIGMEGNFFELGGHSLRANLLINRIQRELDVKIPLTEIFEAPTIRGLANFIRQAAREKQVGIEVVEEKEYYVLSSSQKRFYVLQQMDLKSTVYNTPQFIILERGMERSLLTQTFNQLIRRHDSFRTFFDFVNGEPVQRVDEKISFKIEYYDAEDIDKYTKGMEQGARDSSLALCPLQPGDIIQNFVRPFDLGHAPLLRLGLLAFENRYILMLDIHHIISDVNSVRLLIKEFKALLEGSSLPKLRIQYKDYSSWQNSVVYKEKIKNQEDYWIEKFADDIPVLNLPYDYPRPTVQCFEGEMMNFEITADMVDELKRFALAEKVTLYMVLLAIFYILVLKLSNQEDIVVGMPVAGRPHEDLEVVIGMFGNTLALRNQPIGSKTFRYFLHEVSDTIFEAFENQAYPFEDLVEGVNVSRDTGRNPIFDVMFAWNDMQEDFLPGMDPIADEIEIPGYKHRVSRFDMTWIGRESQGIVEISIEYCSGLFKSVTIAKLKDYYKSILKRVISGFDMKLSTIQIISDNERDQILNIFNDTFRPYSYKKNICQLFFEFAGQVPHRVALCDQDQYLTYNALEGNIEYLSSHLRKHGVVEETLIGVLSERSLEMIVGIIAILRSGGAYLPIDISYPEERIVFILADSGAEIILTGRNIRVPTSARELVKSAIDLNIIAEKKNTCAKFRQRESQLADESYFRKSAWNPENLAYAIYTSGSTGCPKGTLIRHSSVLNILYSMERYYPLCEDGAYLFKTNYTFDVSVTEIFGWIPGRARLVVLGPYMEGDPAAIIDNIWKFKVSHINFVPSMMNLFLDFIDEGSRRLLIGLKYMFVAGEAFSPALGSRVKDLRLNARVENIYGPTEATIYATRYPISEFSNSVIVPIGRPFNNISTYILDSEYNLLPVGVWGELGVGGAGLARGYLNRPDLTHGKFVDSLLIDGEPIYLSGDRARFLPDGNIEFLGRFDHQVKIRGFRVELGEIENLLMRRNDIKEAVVVDRTDKNKDRYLCGYVVGMEGISDSDITVELRKHLQKLLPGYMVPSCFVRMERIPLNVNGKTDRKRLPEPCLSEEIQLTRPKSEVERRVSEIWADVLGIESKKISTEATFFELGGHSLRAVLLLSKIHREFNVRMSLTDIFKTSTVSGMSKFLMENRVEKYEFIRLVEKKEYYGLSSAQTRIYIFQQADLCSTSYNMPGVFIFEGKLIKRRFNKAFQNLIHRHETLRTSFRLVDGKVVQLIGKRIRFKLSYRELVAEKDIEDRIKEFVAPFDLAKAPLLRAELIQLQKEKYYILFDMHHIISDGSSVEILIKDFGKLYRGMNLPPLSVQYKDYACWQERTQYKEKLKIQSEYWLEKLDGFQFTQLPVDQYYAYRQVEGKKECLSLGKSLSGKIESFCHRHDVTTFIFLITVFGIVLAREIDQEDITIGIPVSTRDRPDLRDIIGVFLNVLLIRIIINIEDPFCLYLSKCRETVLIALDNQDYPYELLNTHIRKSIRVEGNELFSILFNYFPTENSTEVEDHGFSIRPMEIQEVSPKYDITLYAYDSKDEIALILVYKGNLYNDSTIKGCLEDIVAMIRLILDNEEISVSELALLHEDEDLDNFDVKFESFYKQSRQ